MIKISVIIPIYNMGLYLIECLESVILQTLKDIEIICINDGSTDNSFEILEEYVLKYDNIVIINQENCGVGKSRNNGMDIAKGEYVAFMDPDDYYPENDILECLYNSAKENQVMISGGSLSSLRGETEKTEYFGYLKDYVFSDNLKMNYEQYQFHSGFYRFIYNLEFLRCEKIKFPSYSRYQDPPFFIQAMVSAGEFYAMKKITYCYRQGHKKLVLTPQKTIDYIKGILDALNISREYGFEKLHTIIVENMHDDILFPTYKHIAEGNLELEELVYKINNAMDYRLLKKMNKEIQDSYLLEPKEIKEYINEIIQGKDEFLCTFKKHNQVVIYGAGKVGLMVAEYLKSLRWINVVCFAVSEGTRNPSSINGIPVKTINEVIGYRKKALILIATYSNLHQEIKEILVALEFEHILPMDFVSFNYLD